MKKRNHYVWKHYLKPWTNKNGKIVCKKEGKIIEVNVDKIAVEKYFYKLEFLTTDDFLFIEKIFCNEKNPVILESNKEYLELFSWVNMLISLRSKINDISIQKKLDALVIEFNENIHNIIENSSEKYLQCLYKKDISFYDTPNGIVDFNTFICEQYFRTSYMKRRMMGMQISFKNVNFENCWNIASHILASNLAGTLSMEREHFSCVLLENNTVIPFYTSDQPVINIAANRNFNRQLTVNEFEFYYPITPNLALLMCLKKNLLGSQNKSMILDETRVKNYNAMVISQGGKLIFSNTMKGLL